VHTEGLGVEQVDGSLSIHFPAKRKGFRGFVLAFNLCRISRRGEWKKIVVLSRTGNRGTRETLRLCTPIVNLQLVVVGSLEAGGGLDS
jgi:hypothetical protein